jgi:hypothetical protein
MMLNAIQIHETVYDYVLRGDSISTILVVDAKGANFRIGFIEQSLLPMYT